MDSMCWSVQKTSSLKVHDDFNLNRKIWLGSVFYFYSWLLYELLRWEWKTGIEYSCVLGFGFVLFTLIFIKYPYESESMELKMMKRRRFVYVEFMCYLRLGFNFRSLISCMNFGDESERNMKLKVKLKDPCVVGWSGSRVNICMRVWEPGNDDEVKYSYALRCWIGVLAWMRWTLIHGYMAWTRGLDAQVWAWGPRPFRFTPSFRFIPLPHFLHLISLFVLIILNGFSVFCFSDFVFYA